MTWDRARGEVTLMVGFGHAVPGYISNASSCGWFAQ